MRSPWALLAVVLLLCGLLRTVATERRDKGDDGDDDDDDGAREFEDKVLRAWIEKLIERYNKNIQSATSPTYIQRIAKKSRTSSSAAGPALNHENVVAPLPINSIIFNPYYHPTFYSTYVPYPYGPTTHLIPVSHVPYPPQEYHHRLFIPVHEPLPYEYAHVPHIMSTQQHAPSNSQGEVHEPDRTEGLNGFEEQHTPPPAGLRPFEHEHDHQEGYDHQDGRPFPAAATRDGKLVDSVDIPPSPTSTAASRRTNESHKDEFPSSTSAAVESDATSAPETFSGGSVTGRPSDDNNGYRIPDKSSTTNVLLSSPPVTDVPYSPSSAEDLETSAETEAVGAYADNREEQKPSAAEGDDEPDEPRESADATTMDVIETSTVTEEKTSKTNETTRTPDATTTPSYSTTAAAPLCKNDDCSTTASAETTEHQDTRESPVQARSVYSTTEPASTDDEQSGAISSSTRPSPTSATISEVTEYPQTASTMSNNKVMSVRVSQELTTLTPILVQPSGKSDENTPTGLKDTTLTSTLQPSNGNIMKTTTKLIDVRPTPWIAINGQNNAKNVDRATSISTHNEPTKQTLKSLNRHQMIVGEPAETNLPSGLSTIPSKSLVSRAQATTKKSDVYTHVKTDYYPRAVVKESSSSLKPIVSTTKPSNSVHRKPTFTTAPNDSTYRSSANNQDWYTSQTSLTPQTLKGSDIWYSYLYTQIPPKKDLSEEQINFLLKKLIKLLKPEIEKESLTKDSITRFVTPKHADQEKIVYIILPWIRDTNQNLRNEEQVEGSTIALKTSDKL